MVQVQVETVNITRRDNPYGEPCVECTNSIGDTYVGTSTGPYTLPEHRHCKCFWYHTSVTGLWDEDRAVIENQERALIDDADAYLTQIDKYASMLDDIEANFNDAMDNADYYYSEAEYAYDTASEYYNLALDWYDLAYECYYYEMWDEGDECCAYGEYYESIGADYESAGDEYQAAGEYWEGVAASYELQYEDIADWIDGLYDSYDTVMSEVDGFETMLDNPSLEELIWLFCGDGQLIWV
jgi:hypothetical protein